MFRSASLRRHPDSLTSSLPRRPESSPTDAGRSLVGDPHARLALYIAMAQASLALSLLVHYGLYHLLHDFLRPLQWALLCSIPLCQLQDALSPSGPLPSVSASSPFSSPSASPFFGPLPRPSLSSALSSSTASSSPPPPSASPASSAGSFPSRSSSSPGSSSAPPPFPCSPLASSSPSPPPQSSARPPSLAVLSSPLASSSGSKPSSPLA